IHDLHDHHERPPEISEGVACRCSAAVQGLGGTFFPRQVHPAQPPHGLCSSSLRNFRLADLVTIMNGVCGSFSIFSSAHYLVNNDIDYLWSALAFPLAGLMFDFFDGKVARWRKSSSMLGQELDSLADL
ncbi:unnamed protein product, partial [Mycena citricolor]